MPRQSVGHEVMQPVEIEAVGMHFVDKARQVGGQPKRLLDGQPEIAAGKDELGQQELAPRAGHGVGQIQPVGQTGQVLDRHAQRLGVDIADRLHSGRRQRPVRSRAQESFAQRAAGAPGRQQDGDAAQGQEVVAMPAQQLGRQIVDDRPAGRDRPDLGRCAGRSGHDSSQRI